MIPQEKDGGIFGGDFQLFLLRFGVTSIVLDLASKLFTPETQKCFMDSNTSPTLHQHSGEEIMSGCSSLGELSPLRI